MESGNKFMEEMKDVTNLVDGLVTLQKCYTYALEYILRNTSYEKHCLTKACKKCINEARTLHKMSRRIWTCSLKLMNSFWKLLLV